MQLQVLGPVAAMDGETQVALGGPRQRAVLAVLVAFVNETVTADRLIDEVWGADPPAAARNSLQSMVSNLRRAVKPDQRISIDGEGRGYVLRAPVEAVDSLDFAAMVDEARGLIGSDVDAGVRRLYTALELWRGAPYGDLADEIDVLRAEAARLEELRMRALEYRIEGELTTGNPADVVGELESLIEVHPLREGLSRLLMVALARSGRQAEALRVASGLRRVLAAEIGIEPSPELVQLEQEILDQSVEAPAPTVTNNPYRGLKAFTEGDAARFFGRDELTARLVARLAEDDEGYRLLAVVGASGSGMSSVVRAGLVPAIRTGAVPGSADWVVVQMVPGPTPLRDLETALLRIAVNPPATLLEQLSRDDLGLRDAVNRILPDDGTELLLVVDQFEELFTIADPEESAQFIDVLVGAVTAAVSRARIVITLRADFYDRPLGDPGLAPLLAERMETVVAMTPDELSQAIVGPAELAGVRVEPGLVAAVVADATGQPGVLPMVQYALTELFEQRNSDVLTLTGYQELGGVRGAIGRRAETLYETLNETQQHDVRNVLLQLVTLGDGKEGTRRRVAREELTGDAGDVIDAFAAARLLSLDQDPATDRATVEVAHEALLREWPRLGAWIDENQVVPDSDRDTAEVSTAAQVAKQQPAEIESARADNSIAVLPFVNMSSDEEQEYFSDGLSEELLNLLARIPELKVAARTSSFSFKGKDLGVPEIASQLGVTHVLEGSVRKHGGQLRITAQLIQAGNGYQLWSETYDRQLDNVFQIQENIAIAVVDALRITLLGDAPRARRTDPRAYQLFLEGQYLKRQFSYDSLNRAVDAFKQAVEIDPAYVPAWAELADTYLWDGGSGELSREERAALADQAIQTAISTDPDYAFAYYVRGISWFFSKHRFEQGIEDFEHALALDPDDAFIVAAIGKGAFLTGQYDLAIAQYQAALAMDPVVPEFCWFLGKAYLSSGRLDDAEASFRKLSRLSPSYSGDFGLFETLLLKGDSEAALAESDTDLKRAIAHFAAGNTAKADEALADLIGNAGPYSIAMVYGYRGEVDKTFEWLDSLLGKGDYYPTWILTETAFRSIHSDPRWESLLEKLGLLEFWLEMTPD